MIRSRSFVSASLVLGGLALACAVALPSQAQGPAPATFPFEVELVKPLGFRTKPGLDTPHVLPHPHNYLQPPARVRVLSATGAMFAPSTFCNVEYAGKQGFIRCDDATAFKTIGGGAPAPAPAPAAGGEVEKLRLAADPSPVLRLRGDKTFFYRGELQIDADGAPRAYHPGFTCDAGKTSTWKHPAKIDCASRTADACERAPRSGFKDDPAAGATGTYVTCDLRKVNGKLACTEKGTTTRTQGGCTLDANESQGLDSLKNAGHPGNWYGIATDKSGTPLLQGPGDPAPGFYVSTTALLRCNDKQSCYLDSTKINYIAIPKGALDAPFHAQKGDYVAVINWKTGKVAGAVLGDIGGNGDRTLGEGSMALAAELGISGTPRGTGGHGKPDVVYVVFAGSTQGFPTDNAALEKAALDRFAKWGGVDAVKKAAPEWAAEYGK